MSTATEEKVKPEEIDLSDLSLQGEEIEVNGDADAFSAPPPPPERDSSGKVIQYRVHLRHREGKATYKQGKTKTGNAYIATSLEAKIVDPGGDFDGITLYDGFVSTLNNRQGTNRMAGILRALGVPVPGRLTSVELARLFQETLNGEPECTVEIEWSAYSEEENATVLKGMKRWPKDAAGNHKGEATYEKTGETVRARADIAKYLPLG
jgi:hypothetical protein